MAAAPQRHYYAAPFRDQPPGVCQHGRGWSAESRCGRPPDDPIHLKRIKRHTGRVKAA